MTAANQYRTTGRTASQYNAARFIRKEEAGEWNQRFAKCVEGQVTIGVLQANGVAGGQEGPSGRLHKRKPRPEGRGPHSLLSLTTQALRRRMAKRPSRPAAISA